MRLAFILTPTLQAGLFSATVVAFLIDSYKWLQSDTGASTVAILMQISKQLGVPNSTIAIDPSMEFAPSSSQVRINVL